MSSLKDRLRRLKGSARSSGSDGSAAGNAEPENMPSAVSESLASASENEGRETASSLPASGNDGRDPISPMSASGNGVRDPATLVSAGQDWDRLGVYLAGCGGGTFLKRRVEYPLSHGHGLYRFEELLPRTTELAVLVGGGVDHRRILFLDTETTGLGVGAGNVPFMIGLGFYETESFVVEQLFIRHPGEEAAMLGYLQEKLDDYPIMASYNGRTFDWPVIRNRYVMNRMTAPDTEPKQLDFLYTSRSLWKHTLDSCRLSRVEESRLGIRREEDVPGSLAPTLYFQYLAEGSADVLGGVFAHNERDVMTLAVLAIHVSRAAAGELSVERMAPEEAYRLALWLQRIGRERQALAAMDRLNARGSASLMRYLPQMAGFYKKLGHMQEAVALWQAYIEEAEAHGLNSLEPYVELAMHYEHGLRDPTAALAYAQTAWDRLRRRKSLMRKLSAQLQADEAALRHRIERLERKCSRPRLDDGSPAAGKNGRRRAGASSAAPGSFAASAPCPSKGARAAKARSRPASGTSWEQSSFPL